MKSFISLILGLTLAVLLVVAGFAGASWMLSEPRPHQFAHLDEPPLWTTEPVRVDPQKMDFQRIAAAPVPPVFQAMAVDVPDRQQEQPLQSASIDPLEAEIDMTTTGAIEPGSMADAVVETTDLVDTPHSQWCAERYRSYRVEDNTYQPYDGPRRACESPYLIRQDSVASSAEVDQTNLHADSDHVSWCLERYRSYRPDDNTYQPFQGPRRPCESPFG